MTDRKIENIFILLKDILIEFEVENKNHINGIPENEYIKLETMYGKMFPYAYSLFLKTFANDLLNIFDMQNHNYTGILEAYDVSGCLLKAYNKSIQNKYFVVAHNCRTSFFYFIDNGSNNPDVFLYNEELKYDSNYKLGNEYVLVNRPMGKFTAWLINKVICHIITCKKDFVKIKETKHKLEQIIASTNDA